MNERVDVHIHFTDGARRQVNARYGAYANSLKAPTGVHLAKGDFVEFLGLEELTFVVLGRVVKFTGDRTVSITYLLDLADPEDAHNKLRPVNADGMPEK